MRYQNLELWIDEAGESFRAHARFGDSKGRADVDLSDWMKDLVGRERKRILEVPEGRRDDVPELAKSLGDRLFRAVFRDEVLRCWHKARMVEEGEGVRICLHLGSARLAQLPWELMLDLSGRDSLGVSSRFPISRLLDHSKAVRRPISPPVRILICDSVSESQPPLKIEEEIRAIKAAWSVAEKEKIVVIEHLRDATLTQLLSKLGQGPWHILHLIGHGTPKGLHFKTVDGAVRLVDGQRWGVLAENQFELRLVVLNCCYSAASSPGYFFSSAAEELSRSGVPAVVGMRRRIDDESAALFAGSFYRELAGGAPVDRAAAAARRMLFFGADKGRRPSPAADSVWATPVVYLAHPDGQIIDWSSAGKQFAALPRQPEGAQEPDFDLGGLGPSWAALVFWILALTVLLATGAYSVWEGLEWIQSMADHAATNKENGAETSERGTRPPVAVKSASKLPYKPFSLFQAPSQQPPLFVYCVKDIDLELGRQLAERHRQGEVIIYRECLKYSRTEPALLYRYGKLQENNASPETTAGRYTIQKWLDATNGERRGSICWTGRRGPATGSGACSHHGGVMTWLYKQRDSSRVMAEVCIDRTLLSTAAGGCGEAGVLARIYNRDYP